MLENIMKENLLKPSIVTSKEANNSKFETPPSTPSMEVKTDVDDSSAIDRPNADSSIDQAVTESNREQDVAEIHERAENVNKYLDKRSKSRDKQTWRNQSGRKRSN